MNITKKQVRMMSQIQGLTLPKAELGSVAARLSTWLTAMEQIEAELGDQMNLVDPIPPIRPHED
jgi:hypothetical protein